MHHKKRKGLMLIPRLAAAQGCLLSSDINTGGAPRRQILYFFDLTVGGGWAYFPLGFSDCGHSSGETSNLSGTEATPCSMDSRAVRLLGRLEVRSTCGSITSLGEPTGVSPASFKTLQETRGHNGMSPRGFRLHHPRPYKRQEAIMG